MRDDIRTLLDRLDDLYPQERIAASRERWRRVWAREPPADRLPWVASSAGYEYYCAGLTPEQALVNQLQELLRRGPVEDDRIPALFTGCHQGTIPEMFGASEEIRGNDYTSARLFAQAAQAMDLRPAEIAPHSIAARWLDMQRYFLEETEGRLPIHVTDMQGPLDVLGNLCGYDEALAAPLDCPEAYEHAMDLIADAFAMLWRAQERLLGDRFIGTHLFAWSWVPAGTGATLSMDSLVMVSPVFFRRHVRPWLERLAGELGGLTVHSCGDFRAQVAALCECQGLRGINAGQMGAQEVAAAMTRKLPLIANCSLDRLPGTLAGLGPDASRVDLTVSGLWADAPVASWGEAECALAAARSRQLNELMAAVGADLVTR